MSKYILNDRELELLQTWLSESKTLPDLLSNISNDLQKRSKSDMISQIAWEKAEKVVMKALRDLWY